MARWQLASSSARQITTGDAFGLDTFAPMVKLGPHPIDPVPPPLTAVLALGPYTDIPDVTTGRRHYERRDAGALVQQAKYGQESSPRTAEQAFAILSEALIGLVHARNECVGVTDVIGVPGSGGFSDRLAADVAEGLKLRLVEIQARNTSKVSAKQDAYVRRPSYAIDVDLTGSVVLVIDDVYHSGQTMAAVAQASIEAGAARAVGLAAAHRLS